MRADELMIGDWYSWEAEGKKYYYQVTKETFSSPDYDIYNFQPIPLTPEILEKNNFKKCVVTNGMEIDKKFSPYHITEQLCIHDGTCGTIVCCSDGGSTLSHLFECKYVNQLQHILKASGILNEIVL